MKKLISVLLIIFNFMFTALYANAASQNVIIGTETVNLETVDVYVNWEKLVTDQDAVIFEGRTLVPLRAICELLNCNVEWNEANQSINISNVASAISMVVGAYEFKKVYISDEQDIETVYIDVPPMIINGRTMVPARAISEVLGADVYWDGVNNRVDIILEFDCMWKYCEDMARVAKMTDGAWKYGFINKERQAVIPLVYDDAQDFENGLACVKKGDKWGYVDKSGNEVVPFVLRHPINFFDGLLLMENNGKYGFVNTSGEEEIPFIYENANSFSEGLAAVKKDGKWGFIDKTGKEVIACIYPEVSRFNEGLASVKDKRGYYGFIDKTGKEVIPMIYDYARDFDEGLAAVCKNDVWGLVDKTGKEAIPMIYDYVWYAENGVWEVGLNGEGMKIDKNGNIIGKN